MLGGPSGSSKVLKARVSSGPNKKDEEGNAFVEMLFPSEHAELILEHEPPRGTCARLQVSTAGINKAVASTDTDPLTPQKSKQ